MADMYYYNGVLLPEIPADVLAEYPYAWIAIYSGNYYLMLSATAAYYDNSSTQADLRQANVRQYKCTADSAYSAWEYLNEVELVIRDADQFHWCNHDIPIGSATGTEIYLSAMIAYLAVDVFTPDTVAISKERMTGIADQARRLGKVSGELTPGQIEEVLRGVTAGAALPSIHPLLIAVDVKPTILPKFAVNDINIVVDASLDVFANAEDTTPPPPPKYSYNGVVLPEIPADVLADYPYAFIRDNNQSGHYDLFLSSTAFYLSDSDTITGAANKPWWRIEKAKADTAQSWEYYKESTKGLGVSEDRTVLWSNHDIPNGSADATEIYFEGSEPVLAE